MKVKLRVKNIVPHTPFSPYREAFAEKSIAT